MQRLLWSAAGVLIASVATGQVPAQEQPEDPYGGYQPRQSAQPDLHRPEPPGTVHRNERYRWEDRAAPGTLGDSFQRHYPGWSQRQYRRSRDWRPLRFRDDRYRRPGWPRYRHRFGYPFHYDDDGLRWEFRFGDADYHRWHRHRGQPYRPDWPREDHPRRPSHRYHTRPYHPHADFYRDRPDEPDGRYRERYYHWPERRPLDRDRRQRQFEPAPDAQQRLRDQRRRLRDRDNRGSRGGATREPGSGPRMSR